MPTPLIKWESIADNLILGDWGHSQDGVSTASDSIKRSQDARLTLIVLIDIAKSLRILRCHNVREIPQLLKEIRKNTKKRKYRRVSKPAEKKVRRKA